MKHYSPQHRVANDKECWELLNDEIFPAISDFMRLIKLPNGRQDEYLITRPLWPSQEAAFMPQKYASDRDINEMMIAKGLPTTVFYESTTELLNKPTFKKVGVLAAWRRQVTTQMGRVTGFCYSPDGQPVVDGLVNTFRDVSVKALEAPSSEPVNFFLEHVRENICNSRVEYAKYVVQWLAHMVQKPAVRPGTGIAVIGEQGTGKGLFVEFIKRILGGPRNANTTASSSDTKSFNFALGNKLFVVFDEATFSGDRHQSDFMKKLVTEPRIRVEQKGIDAYEVDNFARVLITSNNMQTAVPAAIGDRRWLIIECRATVDPDFLKQLVKYVEEPKSASYFKHYLANLPLDDFLPSLIPLQDTGFENKLQGAYRNNAVLGFLWDWLMAEKLTLYLRIPVREEGIVQEQEVPLTWERRILFSHVFKMLEQSCESNHATAPGRNRIGAMLLPFGITIVKRGGGTRFAQFPHPARVLAALKKTSRFDWPITPAQEKYIHKLTVHGTPEAVAQSVIGTDVTLTAVELDAQDREWIAGKEREEAERVMSRLSSADDFADLLGTSPQALDELFGTTKANNDNAGT